MKQVYLLLTAICLAALTGCIKEEYTLEETAITVNVSTRATGTQSTEQGDGINDVNVWAFKYTETIEDALEKIGKDFTISYEGTNNETTVLKWKGENETEANEKVRITNAATAWSRVPAMAAWSSVDVHLQFKACTATEKYILVAVINQGQFGTIKVGSEEKTLGRYTSYSDLINAKFVAPADLMGSNPGNGKGEDPDYMPISHWTTFDLTAAHAGNTHPNTCLVVPMPVYRALAKTQLLVAKSDANSEVTITNVTLGAGPIMGTDGKIISTNAYPTQGALLSAATGQVVKENNTIKALDFVAPGDTTPQWYVSDVAKSTAAVTKTAFSGTATINKVVTEAQHGTDAMKFENYDYVTSYFLYENKGGSDVWNTASTNGGYYMDVTYNAGAGDKTERVWLPAVVRNHDIQVRALVNAGGKLELTFNVQPWTNVPTSWNYTDVVEITAGNEISWQNYDTEKSIIEPTDGSGISKVVMKKNNSGTWDNLLATFTISNPTDAKWYASFVGGDINSFKFVDANGDLVSTISGQVGEQAILQIAAANNNITTAQMVNLDIVIVTADGRTLKSAQLTNNCTIQLVQNPN